MSKGAYWLERGGSDGLEVRGRLDPALVAVLMLDDLDDRTLYRVINVPVLGRRFEGADAWAVFDEAVRAVDGWVLERTGTDFRRQHTGTRRIRQTWKGERRPVLWREGWQPRAQAEAGEPGETLFAMA